MAAWSTFGAGPFITLSSRSSYARLLSSPRPQCVSSFRQLGPSCQASLCLRSSSWLQPAAARRPLSRGAIILRLQTGSHPRPPSPVSPQLATTNRLLPDGQIAIPWPCLPSGLALDPRCSTQALVSQAYGLIGVPLLPFLRGPSRLIRSVVPLGSSSSAGTPRL